jgi:hypothetical protein
MQSWSAMGWLLLLVLALGVGFFLGALVLHWLGRRQIVGSLTYILDRLKLAEYESRRSEENQRVLVELLRRRGLVDDEDMAELRRELIDRPRQLEAERAELLEQAQSEEVAERLIKNVNDTVH